jgi:DNA/RNA-binding domain of Phe-tRNA-synthetase-like protein
MTGELVQGWCEQELQQELPGLGLVSVGVELAAASSPTGASPPGVVERLRELSGRWRGRRATAVRGEPVPAAYRVLFRQLGLDPDETRTPIEQALLVRMLEGGFRSHGLLDDILTLALVDTGVPVWALDAAAVDGPLGIRASRDGELLWQGAHGTAVPGRLVVADARAAIAILFADPPAGYRPTRATRELLLYAVRAPEVSALHVEEALWACQEALAGAVAPP